MCGIAGIIGSLSDRERKLDAMLNAQQHRGPDHTEKYSSSDIALGHNRLSIIDLSAAAHQPFFSTDNRYVLVFNGEIYNYKELKKRLESRYTFTTSSDTEVLLAAYIVWGCDCLHHLNGMFSFAVWDNTEQEFFAARDRFGVKPFYYYIQERSVIFASEIKSLFAAGVDREPWLEVWSGYMTRGDYGAPDQTFWKGIQQLPGGHYMTIKNSKPVIKQWYNFTERVLLEEQSMPFKEAKSHYLNLLEESIELRFRADVPVGFNLSGGLDSSTLLAMVNSIHGGKNVNAFTFYTGDDRYDELKWVKQLISTTGNPLHTIKMTAADVPELAQQMSNMQDEPYGGFPTLAYGKLFKHARELGVKVLLDGQGMDEQWAGYDYYNKAGSKAVIQGLSKSPFRLNVLDDEFVALSRKRNYPKPFNNDVLDTQYRDLFYNKIPRALRFNDRVSMAASTELREPFLDYRLVEFAFSQPLDYKINNGVQKYLVRELMKPYMNNSISLAPKRPLQTPQREWLGEDLKDWVYDVLNSTAGMPFINKSSMLKELEMYMKGDRDSSFHIWQWINMSLLFTKQG
ncbi:MAG: asparagine synthase (glutamine-hydrolyzing) [Nonlabens sp.]